jgi:hypothetical protein
VANPLGRLEVVRLLRTLAYLTAQRLVWSEIYQPGGEPFERTREILRRFASEVRADGATPVVVVHPTSRQIADQRDRRPKVHGALLAALESHGIPTIDLTDALGERARSVGVSELIETHYRPAGNELVAEVLAQKLPGLIQPTCSQR